MRGIWVVKRQPSAARGTNTCEKSLKAHHLDTFATFDTSDTTLISVKTLYCIDNTHALQFMEFIAWFMKIPELYELLKVHRAASPYSYSWVHGKMHIHIHGFIAMSVFIFTSSCIFKKWNSWVHRFIRYDIYAFIDFGIFIFIGSCIFLYSYSCFHTFFMNYVMRFMN